MPSKNELKKIRKDNQKKTLTLLKKQSYFCKDIAKEVGVSNVAMYDILEDFISKNIVKVAIEDLNSVGRKPVKYQLNNNYGIFIAIDMTLPDLRFCFHNLTGDYLLYKNFPIDTKLINTNTISAFIAEIKNALNSEQFKYTPLKNICISTPGRIDQKTNNFIAAATYENATEINLKKLFSDEFNCPVFVKNNVYLAFNGEIDKYHLEDYKDILYLYMNNSIGGAIRLNGEIRNGANNFAGEIGCYTTFNGQSLSKYINPADILLNYKKLILNNSAIDAEELNVRLKHSIQDLIDLYNKNDTFAMQTLNQTAEYLTTFILNMQSLVDCDLVCIQSHLLYQCENFKQTLNELISAKCWPIKREVLFTKPDDLIFIQGCINYAIDKNIMMTLQLDD